jgi:hypothetical protein
LRHQRADSGVLQHLVGVDDFPDFLAGERVRALDGPPMDAARPIGFAQPTLGDQKVDHRRHFLRLEAPDDPLRSGHDLGRRRDRAHHAPLESGGHGNFSVLEFESKTPGAAEPRAHVS